MVWCGVVQCAQDRRSGEVVGCTMLARDMCMRSSVRLRERSKHLCLLGRNGVFVSCVYECVCVRVCMGICVCMCVYC